MKDLTDKEMKLLTRANKQFRIRTNGILYYLEQRAFRWLPFWILPITVSQFDSSDEAHIALEWHVTELWYSYLPRETVE